MIRLENVSYTYPFQDRPAVEDVSLHVRPGEIVLCTGASGCGKSTLIRLVNGLCPHYYQGSLRGEVLMGGRPTREQSLAELSRQAGTLFQDPEQQFFALGVEEELVFALEWQGISVDRMREAADRTVRDFDLGPVLHSSIHSLSEGQKQKVGLASICMQEPKALILDEPTANLDPESTVALARKLRELRERGMAVLVADHRLYWLEGLADRVLIMEEGRIREEGGFDLLQNAALRERYGLRSVRVEDKRGVLPACPSGICESSGSSESSCCEDGEALLEVEGLSFAYRDRPPLYENASFRLPCGVTALIGPNGAGKTTLARVLAGLNRAGAGVVRLAGRTVDERERLHASGIVLQNADHQLHMRTVRQELETCLTLAGSRDFGRVDALLETFALASLADRHPQSLSGGEKQRLVIACALTKNPRLLILDEPTSGLDGSNMRRLASALKREADEGRCILLITHDLELLERIGRYALRVPFASARETDAETARGAFTTRGEQE